MTTREAGLERDAPTPEQAAFLAPVNAVFAKFADRVDAIARRFDVDPVDLERAAEHAARVVVYGDPIPLEPLPRPRRGLAFEVERGVVTSLRPAAAAAFYQRTPSAT